MSKKPEALRLAHLLQEATTVLDEPFHHDAVSETCDKAAAELRRLHADNERLMTRLLEAIDKALRYDLDAVGISNREKEVVELAELRADNERLTAENERLKRLLRETITQTLQEPPK